MTDVLEDLAWRDLIAQSTDLDELRALLAAGPVTLYCGFDPTAPSLHLGNLIQILTLRRFQLAGHRPIGLVGGATGLIGDPSGKSAERTLNSEEVVAAWVERIRAQVAKFLDFEGPNAALMVSNLEWTGPMTAIEFLRDIGKHFPVNRMLARETVKTRLETTGMSYTEFSYVLLQAMDFLELYRRYGCRLQTGGSDQWGNLTAGVDLIRRVEGGTAHALTTPLLTKADGTKFGKTAGGETYWLDPELTSPYAFYQFWINADDRDVEKYLKVFSFRPREEIQQLVKESAERPAARIAQRALAEEVTTLVHGADECAKVVAASRALFGQGALEELDERTLGAALAEVPRMEIPPGDLPPVVDLLAGSGLCKSKSEARRTIAQGGAYLNNTKVTSEEAVPTTEDLLHGRFLVLRRGKRNVGGVEVVRRA
ncbi:MULTISPECIES: tyrosine--tRNA ligase [Thermomonospora]|uniref:Tyrosine--tRNA ligase n=1 Tax=Thermomonospora curvata (strain ATCC 19995 / DSM 43183 / JCM 3096 / KCTC 9072 / NBRC 15933 / NCIMB 10081 / Henssen B9) TaxID=471852 RepID=D1A1N8_THECD|nr:MULTISPECIES: tyrosine--tRNA ligase [Thermomonospora]ACY97726.1 tyrosyl-tRNA synthetase [Thermomonospora curvata DSM 43183]PKK14469.1 MAG: tyrosine--tRNA ligase [Thermomonospora sp. CIF 1]